MTRVPLTSEMRENLKKGLRRARLELERAEAQLDEVEDALSALRLVMKAVQPAHDGVQWNLITPVWNAGWHAPIPFPATARANFLEDAVTLRECAERIARTVLNDAAFEQARREGHELNDLVETAFVATINLRDFSDPSWPRVRREHLARGYEIVAARRYCLYGESRSGDVELPGDIERFPRTPQ